MNYKTISFTLHANEAIVEFDLKRNQISDEKEFIDKMSTFFEFIGYNKFKEVIFTNVKPFFSISKSCHDYVHRQIVDAMTDYGVDKIYFEIPKNKNMELYISENYGITAITNKYEIIKTRIKNENMLN